MPNKYFHLSNRGVGGNKIFYDVRDYLRFLEYLKVFNSTRHIEIRLQKYMATNNDASASEKPDQLVEILAFCLLPNHFHILIKPIKEKGVALFMQKIGTGYSMYFNAKYKKQGHVFQGKYKMRVVEPGQMLLSAITYIHLSPVNKKREFQTLTKVHKHDVAKALSYPWSSFQNYTDVKLESPLELKKLRNIVSKQDIVNALSGREYTSYIAETSIRY